MTAAVNEHGRGVRTQADCRNPFVLAIDVGSSSVRAALYDANARRVPDTEASVTHPIHATPDGGAEEFAEHLVENVEGVVDAALERAGEAARHIAGIGMDTMASTFLGVNQDGNPVTPVYTYADTRSSDFVRMLRRELDVQRVYQRTGCPQHTSYLPARFLWLRHTDPEMAARVSRWVDVGTYLYTRWFGRLDVPTTYSIASWSGLLDRHRLQWDEELLRHLPVTVDALPRLSDYADAQMGLAEPFAERWPALRDVPFFLAVGDGVSANVGSGCVSPARAALTVGTSGAMRFLLSDTHPKVPRGLWAYRFSDHTLLGGSFSDGGSVFAWARNTVRLPSDAEELETALQSLPPDGHGLTVLPFLSGERSPGWAADATGVVAGLRMTTTPVHVLQAALEAVAFRFAAVWDMLAPFASDDAEIVANGGAITSSPYWLQVMADVLRRPVTVCTEDEATSRGTAILALKALGIWATLDTVPAAIGQTHKPNPGRAETYNNARKRQAELYDLVIGQGS